jgi:TPR repeat protein
MILAYRLDGGEPKWEEAIQHLTFAAEHGLVRAWLPLWLSYKATGRGREKFDVLRKGAQGGDTAAQLRLFKCYANGELVPRDEREAEHWGVLAAEGGNPEYQRLLAEFYIARQAPRRNTEAGRWLNSAYAAGDKKAAYLLGIGYLNEAGKPGADPQTGLRLLREAADAGVADAEEFLAGQYLMGVFVERDVKEARRWLKKAGAHGSVTAKSELRWLDFTARSGATSAFEAPEPDEDDAEQ